MKMVSALSVLLFAVLAQPALGQEATEEKSNEAEASKNGMLLPEPFNPVEPAEAGSKTQTFRDCAPMSVGGQMGRATIIYTWKAHQENPEATPRWELDSFKVEVLHGGGAARCG